MLAAASPPRGGRSPARECGRRVGGGYMRPASNPPNPFLSAHAEWLDAPPAATLQVYEEDARSILSENESPDLPFRWSLNPYRGCHHACAYCYARPYHEYLGFGAGTDFDTRICVKRNAASLLEKTLAARAWRRERIAFSGVTDCYQPLEAVYGLTRACLEVCATHRNPVSIVTKAMLIIRDIDVLSRLERVSSARVYFSVTFADDDLARKIEPGAPPPSRRFQAMKELDAAGIPVGVMLAPIIPGLNDRDIPVLLERAALCGARAGAFMPLRLPGSVAAVFLERLRAALPDHAGRVEARIADMRGGELHDGRFCARMTGVGAYWQSVEALFAQAARRCGLNTAAGEAPRSEPSERTISAPARARQLPLFDEEPLGLSRQQRSI